MAERARHILIDGRSGSGKTEFALAIAEDWPEAQLVRLDDLYPGWDGLDQGSAQVPLILTAFRYRSWDWATDRSGKWHELDRDRPIIVEGVGALSRDSRALADYAIWVELESDARKRRALARDGEAYAPHWDRWAAQEKAFIARESPTELADVIIDGAQVTQDVARSLSGWRALLDPARVGE